MVREGRPEPDVVSYSLRERLLFFSVQDVIDNVDAEETSSSGGSEKL